MEENKKCIKCGAPLLTNEQYCPVCGMLQVNKQKSYWKNPFIWGIVIVLLIVTNIMSGYMDRFPLNIKENKQPQEAIETLKIGKPTTYYAQATNLNSQALSYVGDDKVYLALGDEMLVYSRDMKDQQQLMNQHVSSFSEDDKYYYYLDEQNDYFREDKKSRQKETLLNKAYYVHRIDSKVYYQKDTDKESIHCFNLDTGEDSKINDEVSYSIIVDEEKGRIFYINNASELISIAMDGSDRKALASNTNVYTYDGEYLYYINSTGLVKSDLEGQAEDIYHNNNLKLVNIVNEHLVVHDGNAIYTMNLVGKKVKQLYTIETSGRLTFEVVGDHLLVLAKSSREMGIGYELISLDGKRQILETGTSPSIIGEEI